jgi:hypothetical protein
MFIGAHNASPVSRVSPEASGIQTYPRAARILLPCHPRRFNIIAHPIIILGVHRYLSAQPHAGAMQDIPRRPLTVAVCISICSIPRDVRISAIVAARLVLR